MENSRLAQDLRYQIAEYERKIASLIEENSLLSNKRGHIAEAIRKTAGIRNDFDYMISRERTRSAEVAYIASIRIARSYSEQMGELLTGYRYSRAQSSFDGINTRLKQEDSRLKDKIDGNERLIHAYRDHINYLKSRLSAIG